jgi:hypothetical protein
MHTKQKIIFLLLGIFTIQSQFTHSQYRRRGDFNFIEGMSITPQIGYNIFYGDLVDESRGSISLGVLLDREINELFSARVQITGGKMQGTQNTSSDLAYASFDNFYTQFTVGASYKPLNQILGCFKQRTIQPYAHLNTGFVFYNATEYWEEGSIGPAGEEWRSGSGIAPVVTMGGGTSIWLTPTISFNMEFSGALPFTDKMDAHDVWYNTLEDWVSQTNPHETAGNDFYYTIMAGITITLQESRIKNSPKYNRKSFTKTRNYYRAKAKRSTPKHKKRRR